MAKFRYSKYFNRRTNNVPAQRPVEVQYENDSEALTGYVHGEKASDLEERLARAMDKRGISYSFQVPIAIATSLPGEEKQVDFIVQGRQPVEPRSYISHFRSIGQRAYDRIREIMLNEAFNQMGLLPLRELPEGFPKNQEEANEFVLKEFA